MVARKLSKEIITKQHVIGYLIATLKAQKNYSAYCKFLVFKLLPAISKAYPELVKSCVDYEKNYLTIAETLSNNIVTEVQKIVDSLEQDIITLGLQDHPDLKLGISLLRSILKFTPEEFIIDGTYDATSKSIVPLSSDDIPIRKSVWLMPSQADIAFERIKTLVINVVNINNSDLVSNYVEPFGIGTRYVESKDGITVYQCNDCFKVFSSGYLKQREWNDIEAICPLCKRSLQRIYNSHIEQFFYVKKFNEAKFIPSMFKRIAEDEKFCTSAAGAWSMLDSIETEWESERRHFFKKDLTYSSLNDCNRASNLLKLNLRRLEVKNIKKNKLDKVHLLNRKLINNNVNIIYKAIIGEELDDHQSQFNGPEKLTLEIVDIDLRIHIMWGSSLVETCIMTYFHSSKNDARLNFFRNMINNPGELIKLHNSQTRVPKCLKDAGFSGELKKLFIKQSNKGSATLNASAVNLEGQSAASLKKIRRELQKFKSWKWDKSL